MIFGTDTDIGEQNIWIDTSADAHFFSQSAVKCSYETQNSSKMST